MVVALALAAGCQPGFYTSDCASSKFPMKPTSSRIALTRSAAGGRLDGRVRESSRKGPAVTKAWVLVPDPNGGDTLRIPVDSTGAFARDGMPLGPHKVIVTARWYWAAFDSVDVRADSGVQADVRLEATPQGWYSCIPH